MMEPLAEADLFPGTKWHDIGNGIAWRPYKHWGSNVWAGEGLFYIQHPNGKDGSGCLKTIASGAVKTVTGTHYINNEKFCSPPTVVEARTYQKGSQALSAVFSYPNGIGLMDSYFWEIYPVGNEDIERFKSEEEMEEYIKQLFAEI